MNLLPTKSSIHTACLQELQEKITRLEQVIRDAQQSAAEDTKSSAGDKYETSREMMKQEINKANQQLAIYEKMQQVMMNVKVDETKEEIGLGSLIETSEGLYYFSVSLGQVKVDKKKVYVLSMASPLGQILLGKKVGESVEFRGRKVEVLGII